MRSNPKDVNYRWISGNKVIMLEYHDTGMTKPEPIEAVRAYLAKHPSTACNYVNAGIKKRVK